MPPAASASRPPRARRPHRSRRPRRGGTGVRFRWFVPELLKHKPIWRDVLAASAAIQLLALATPLFTQVVIDKVVVHQTVNTLVVIGVALVVVTLFSTAMSWVRQYLVLHTGSRVDAVLGTRVFEHLVGLPARLLRAPADRHDRRAGARRRDDSRVRQRRGGDAAARPAVPRDLSRVDVLVLSAPQDGIVKDFATYTLGSVLQPGTVLMTLVPTNDPMQAEVWVQDDDAGFVGAGRPVKLKPATYPFQKYGMIEGTVRRISPDASDAADARGPPCRRAVVDDGLGLSDPGVAEHALSRGRRQALPALARNAGYRGDQSRHANGARRAGSGSAPRNRGLSRRTSRYRRGPSRNRRRGRRARPSNQRSRDSRPTTSRTPRGRMRAAPAPPDRPAP